MSYGFNGNATSGAETAYSSRTLEHRWREMVLVVDFGSNLTNVSLLYLLMALYTI